MQFSESHQLLRPVAGVVKLEVMLAGTLLSSSLLVSLAKAQLLCDDDEQAQVS